MSDNTSPTGDSENPYAPPVAAVRTSVGDSVQFAPGFFEIVDGVVICSGDFSISPLCIETGEPVRSGDIRDYKAKLFAPKQNRKTLFRFLHFLHLSMFLLGILAGRVIDGDIPRIKGIPAGIFFLLYFAVMIFLLFRVPSLSLVYRRSKEGARLRRRKKILPIVILSATTALGLFGLKYALGISGLLAFAIAALTIIVFTVTMHYENTVYATRDAAGRFHIHGLQAQLIAVLQRHAQQVGS